MGDVDEPTAGDEPSGDDAAARRAALDELPDGSGCAEIWDYLSERRRRD